MLQEQTLDMLNAMKLFGMAKGFSQRLGDPKHGELSHADFLGLLNSGHCKNLLCHFSIFIHSCPVKIGGIAGGLDV